MGSGSTKERELIHLLGDEGWAAMRAPASGSATERELPDILAGRPCEAAEIASLHVYGQRGGRPVSSTLAIEAKYRSSSLAYFDNDEIADLITFGEHFGAIPLIASRWHGRKQGTTEWFFQTAESVPQTRTKAKLDFEEVKENWHRIEWLQTLY